MIPFQISLRPGTPLSDQIVYAAKKAVVSGQLRPGDPFPSVRILSKELKINPNTAHKVITQLVNEGVLQVHPGTGTAVAALPPSSTRERAQWPGQEIEQLVGEAKRCGIDLDSVLAAVQKHWRRLGGRTEPQVSFSKEEEPTRV